MKYSVLAATAAVFLTTGAALQAQPAGPEGAAPTAPPAASAPSASAPSATAESYTDADLKAFARAAIAASKIQGDATIAAAEKQPKMLAAVQAEGLDPAKFNAIAQASQSDPALKKKIQEAATADAGAQPAPSQPTP